MVWILEWSKPCDSEHGVTLWDTEEEARKSAAESIQESASYLDQYDPEHRDLMTELNGHIMAKNWKACMNVWADWQEAQDSDQEYYSCYQQAVLLKAPDPVINALLEIDDDEEENDLTLQEEDDKEEEVYLATTPGATCRGPCKNYSPYAYADQRDGTFHCCQCKTFKNIFSS